jgi:stearoyl-CoA desaturase (delta-9 desaturase)
MAVLTFGEGYHNYHHAFAADYRNGIRWYHFDPTKWTIWTAAKLGLVKSLRVINEVTVLKSLVYKDKKMILEHLSHEMDDCAAELKLKLEELSVVFEEKATVLMAKLRELKQASSDQKKQLQVEVKSLRASLNITWDEWVEVTSNASKQYEFAH